MSEMREAKVRLERGDTVWYWVVAKCPYCGKRHAHGGGLLDEDPRVYLSSRVPHCSSPRHDGMYTLVEA